MREITSSEVGEALRNVSVEVGGVGRRLMGGEVAVLIKLPPGLLGVLLSE